MSLVLTVGCHFSRWMSIAITVQMICGNSKNGKTNKEENLTRQNLTGEIDDGKRVKADKMEKKNFQGRNQTPTEASKCR